MEDDIMSFEYLTTTMGANYVRYIQFAKLYLNISALLLLLYKLNTEGRTGRIWPYCV